MTKAPSIHLGFEIGTGASVNIPLKHMAVTGQTQESGKTTTLEALAARSQTKTIAFMTKRGERGFASGRQIMAFFEERADWEFIESILESAMHERMKFERAWIVRACKGAKTLADVQRNVQKLMGGSKRSMDQDIYMLLGEYLSKVVPLVQRLPKTSTIELEAGLNVMNLVDYPEELQMLIVGSTLRWIHAHAEGVVTVIPEAWKFCPQGRKTPVKLEVERLAREGAGIKNYIWIDSQDMAGVEKTILRAAPVWLIGVQREVNEVKRALGNMPGGVKKPKAEDVSRLHLGQFYACWLDTIQKVYVQPEWVSDTDARAIAMGLLRLEDLQVPQRAPITVIEAAQAEEDQMADKQLEQENLDLKQKNKDLEREIKDLKKELGRLMEERTTVVSVEPRALGDLAALVSAPVRKTANGESELEAIYAYVVERLRHDPQVIRLAVSQPQIDVEVVRETVTMSNKTLGGKLAHMLSQGFFDEPHKGQAAYDELMRQNFPAGRSKPNVYRELDKLAAMGFLTKEPDGYKAVPSMKVNIVKP